MTNTVLIISGSGGTGRSANVKLVDLVSMLPSAFKLYIQLVESDGGTVNNITITKTVFNFIK